MSTRQPNASAVTQASSATGRSLVPAQTTPTRPARDPSRSSARQTSIPERGCQRASGATSRTASACPAVALVTSTGEASWASREATIAGRLGRRLAGAVDDLGPAPQGAVVVDPGEAEVLERQGRQAGHGVLGGQLAPGHGAEKLSKPTFIQSLRIVAPKLGSAGPVA